MNKVKINKEKCKLEEKEILNVEHLIGTGKRKQNTFK